MLQLEDSLQPVAGATRPRRTTWSARATCGRSSTSCGSPAPRRSPSTASGSRRRARSSTSARPILVNSAYLAPPYQITALGPPDLYDRLSAAPGFIDFVRARAEAYGIRLSFAEPASVDIPAFAGTVSLRYSRPVPSASPSPRRPAGAVAMRVRRNQLTIAAVAFVLGLLVVVQLRAQAGSTGLAALSAQDLTVLVANLNERNDQLRARGRHARARARRRSTPNQARGDASIDEIRTDLRRVRAYAGLDPVDRPRGDDHGQRADRRRRRSRTSSTSCATPAPRRSRSAGVRLVPGRRRRRGARARPRSTASPSATRSSSRRSARPSS